MRKLQRFLRDTSGNIATMMALVALPLFIGAGAAVDFSRAHYARTVLQAAADAAALAGGTSKDKSAAALKKAVLQYLEANHAQEVLQYVGKIDQKLDVNKGTFTVTIAGKMDSSFMALAGISELDVSAYSQVNFGTQALEIVMVLDNTGSMAGAKINNLKSAANNLVDIIKAETSDYADAKLAVVPFAEYVNVGKGQQFSSWVDTKTLGGQPFSGCVGSRNAPKDLKPGASGGDYPALASVPCNVTLLPLTTDFNAVKARINSMVATGWTYIPTGLLWGWNVIDSQAPFTEGRSKKDLKKVNGRKAIILMTDGENTISATYPKHDGVDVANSNAKLVSMCEAVKNDEIEIFTVSFMVPSDTIKNILINCASSPAKYFDADNAAELNTAFSQIARDLAAVRLTQ